MLAAATLPGTAILEDEDGAVGSVAFSPDGKTLAIGDEDGTVRLWDVVTGQQIGSPLNSKDGPVDSVAFSPDGKTLAIGVQTMTAPRCGCGMWPPVGRSVRLSELVPAPGSVAFSPDGKTLATRLTVDGRAAALGCSHPPADRQLTQPPGSGGNIVGSIAFSPDGKTLASGARR